MLSNMKARVVLRMAMLCLLAFFAMNAITRWTPSAWEDVLDGVRGALLGVTIGLMVMVGVITRRGRPSADRSACAPHSAP